MEFPSGAECAACVLLLVSPVTFGCGKSNRAAGEICGFARPVDVVQERDARQGEAGDALRVPRGAAPILFGDLHVHSTFSIDAFLQALPIFGGEGAHPPAWRPCRTGSRHLGRGPGGARSASSAVGWRPGK